MTPAPEQMGPPAPEDGLAHLHPHFGVRAPGAPLRSTYHGRLDLAAKHQRK
jgi:hypothetical protein